MSLELTFKSVGGDPDLSTIKKLYRLPADFEILSFPCEIILEVSAPSVLGRKTFSYEEGFRSQIAAIIHLKATLDLISERSISIFSLQYDPIFDVKFDDHYALFSRSDFSFREEIEACSKAIADCLAGIYAESSPEISSLRGSISSAVEALKSDFVSIDYASAIKPKSL